MKRFSSRPDNTAGIERHPDPGLIFTIKLAFVIKDNTILVKEPDTTKAFIRVYPYLMRQVRDCGYDFFG
jgi:hypothetical protein